MNIGQIIFWVFVAAYMTLTVGMALLWIVWLIGGIFGDDGWRPFHNSQRGPKA